MSIKIGVLIRSRKTLMLGSILASLLEPFGNDGGYFSDIWGVIFSGAISGAEKVTQEAPKRITDSLAGP